MKKYLIIILFTSFIYSQNKTFTFSPEGFTDFVVTDCPNKTKEEIFNKTINWIKKTYNDPKEVIKAEIVNDYVRFEGVSENVLLGTFMGMDTVDKYKYHIEVSVKDNKYKFDIISIQNYTLPSQYTIGGWNPLNISSTENYYKKGKIKNSVKYLPETLPKIFNDLNTSLFNFINSTEEVKSSEW